jgi:hypothetical protein
VGRKILSGSSVDPDKIIENKGINNGKSYYTFGIPTYDTSSKLAPLESVAKQSRPTKIKSRNLSIKGKPEIDDFFYNLMAHFFLNDDAPIQKEVEEVIPVRKNQKIICCLFLASLGRIKK